MPLYFRSDSRAPTEIFEIGFQARVDKGNEWWLSAIKATVQQGIYGKDYQCTDASTQTCVCMSSNFLSSALFPLGNNETYIYLIALPEATKVKYCQKNKKTAFNLDNTTNEMLDTKNLVLDLHSLQASQVRNIIGRFFKNKKLAPENIAPYAGWALYAYEALAYQVSSQNIIGAIKIKTEELNLKTTITSQIPFSKTESCEMSTQSLDRKFSIQGEIIFNKNFKIENYPAEYIDAVNVFNAAKNKSLETPNIYYGLGGKCF